MKAFFEFSVPEEFEQARLDAALAVFRPGSGLRARRRLWETGDVLVNGVPRKPGWLVRTGDVIGIRPDAGACPGLGLTDAAPPEEGGQPPSFGIIGHGGGFIAFDKPEGLHTAHIDGSSAPSLEGELSRHWERLWREHNALFGAQGGSLVFEGGLVAALPPVPRLVTRLDRETSGLVLGLLPTGTDVSEDMAPEFERAVERFRDWERRGMVRKEYFALVKGEVSVSLDLRRRLDTENRRVTKVLEKEEPDPVRHTRAEPLVVLTADRLALNGIIEAPSCCRVCTLLRVEILRGARHQIRAHLAHAGFPILGDPLYGGRNEGTVAMRMFLHHAAVSLPGFAARSMPHWGIGEPLP